MSGTKTTPTGTASAVMIQQVANGYIVTPTILPNGMPPTMGANQSTTVYTTYALADAAVKTLFGEQ